MKTLLLASYQRPYLYLGFFLVILVVTYALANRLSIDSDLNALLPKHFDSIKDLETVKTRFGGIGYIVVTGSGAPKAELERFADEVAKSLNNTPNISFIDYKKPTDFFRDRGFYYLEVDDLKLIEKRVKKRWKWEKRKRNPMYIDLEESEPPSLDFHELQDKYQTSRSKWMSAQQSDETYYFSDDKSFIAIFIKPDMASFDLSFSQQVIDEVEQRIKTIDLSSFSEKLQVELTGRYQKKIDLQKAMRSDLQNASLIALGLVISYLLLHFRRLEAIFLVLLPLTLGILCTFAFAQLVFGQLNILTAFIGIILIGLGIDHGIHLLSRYKDESKINTNTEQIIGNTFLQTGRAVGIATLTTFVTFLGLSLSEFRAFYEFGVIAAAGIIFISLSYLIFLPALLKLASLYSWKIDSSEETTISSNLVSQKILHRPKHRIIYSAVVWIVFTALATQVAFNYDFESLGNNDLPSFQLDKKVNQLLGYSQTPMIALTDNKSEEMHAATQIIANKDQLAENSGIDFILATSDLVPTQQQEKYREIKKIAKSINRMKPAWFDEADAKKLEEVKRMVNISPFSYNDLPEEMKLFFGVQDDAMPNDGIIMLYPSVNLSDGDKVLNLADEIRQVQQTDGKQLVVAGESMVLADILRLVFTELPTVLLLSLALIVFVLWISIKNFVMAMVCLIPAVMTLSCTLGIMAIIGIELNYINVLMLPVLLGISVDSGVHIVTRVMDGEDLHKVIRHTGFAIWGSIITSGLGIGAMLLTSHHGLNSLAQLGTIGLIVNLIVSVFVLPALLSLFNTKKYSILARS